MSTLEQELAVVAAEARAVCEEMEAQRATTAAAAFWHITQVCERFITTPAAFDQQDGAETTP